MPLFAVKRELHIYLIMIWKTKDVFENTDG